MDKFKLFVTACFVMLAMVLAQAHAGQTTFYDARGNVTGKAATDSQGTTTFYDQRGNVVGKASKPRR